MAERDANVTKPKTVSVYRSKRGPDVKLYDDVSESEQSRPLKVTRF